jgi:hypothetical protein
MQTATEPRGGLGWREVSAEGLSERSNNGSSKSCPTVHLDYRT